MKQLYRLGPGQLVVLVSTVVAVLGGIAWILLEAGVLPGTNRFL